MKPALKPSVSHKEKTTSLSFCSFTLLLLTVHFYLFFSFTDNAYYIISVFAEVAYRWKRVRISIESSDTFQPFKLMYPNCLFRIYNDYWITAWYFKITFFFFFSCNVKNTWNKKQLTTWTSHVLLIVLTVGLNYLILLSLGCLLHCHVLLPNSWEKEST